MTDQPIVANSSPAPDQLAAGLRQCVLLASAVASTLGYTQLAGHLSAALTIVGPVAAIIVFAMGQLHTRHASQKVAALASMLPDHIAVVK